ncbi:hypothetical protein BIFBRE_04653 [Bifidobacterium breve DSM 20213 = JCM 1192]|uniref:Uncharacterized protein n=1 Tax=Bifidobacterium breve DSM 20213 = JCM 1192 TaxID=518634 RepID=D4BRB7_BIFBR|nr:hypothetical protein BIFBRE_04653 [Bifidobacterium breve DSM 20213 = JCM 1192]
MGNAIQIHPFLDRRLCQHLLRYTNFLLVIAPSLFRQHQRA